MKSLYNAIRLTGLLFVLMTSGVYADYKGELSQAQAQEKMAAGAITVIDVRSAGEYQAGHVPGALNIPYDQIEQHLDQISMLKNKPVLLYCRSGRRAGMAESTLTQLGFTQLYHLEGDMMDWSKNQLPEEK